jgi:acetyl-CoA carboxylase biotin carboxyl carrier protein
LHHEDVVQILALLDASHFDELRIETAGYKLHLRRSAAAAGADATPPAPETQALVAAGAPPLATASHAASAPPVVSAPLANPQAAPPPLPTPAAAGASIPIKAPMLGTFYGAPQPGAAPFVSVGSTVEPDTVIGIVEVMKLMNAVSAGTSGVVVEIVAKDGTLVEYGEVLLRVAPAAS